MRWQGRRKSDNVEDLRGSGGAGRGLKIGGGVGGLGIVVAILYFLLGGNPGELTQSLQVDQPAATGAGEPLSARDREMGDFISTVLASVEDVWRERFREMGRTYVEPKLVLFTGAVDSACGYAGSSVGPFYCPGDSKVYIDLAFLEDMQRRLRAEGDFAMAYVLAHEVGHHVQNLLGINDRVMAQRGRLSERDFNRLMVRMELQADFLAGIWAHYAGRETGFLESGDIEEGLNAASAVGDDRIMRQTQGYVVPDSFTHGTSEQRARWFRLGLETGDVDRGDTFGAANL
ncbi:MAG: zinc metallopeptidase [Candidatus Aminicenantes bacterium]|nr:zinc metallopeptidase [Candidatus Aminicenantes bacterium]NLH78001.1 zinc metallopeptidase [Acidobacteriota bacterium]